MTVKRLLRSGVNAIGTLAQSTIDVLDSFLTNGVLDRTVVHIRLSLFSPGSGIMTKLKPWFLAIRPKTLTASLVPVIVATALAYATQGHFSWGITLFALLSSFCIQIGTNFINDALDFKKGADTPKRLGPIRVTQSGLLSMLQVHMAGLLFFCLAIMFGIPLILKGGWPIAILMSLSVVFGYGYTGGPKPLAYTGMGDLFVLLFFGIASTVAVFFMQTGTIDVKAVLAGVQIGLLATVLIAINNLRDHVEDAQANKRTLAVRFGKEFARNEIAALSFLPFVLNLLWIPLGYTLVALLPLLTLPIAWKVVQSVWQTEPSKEYNNFLAMSALLHLGFGALMCVAFYLTTV